MSKGIFVVVEQRSGKVQNVGLELIGEATRLKEDLKDDVVAILLGDKIEDQVAKLFHYGADKVILIDSPYLKEYVTEPYTKALTLVCNEYDPEIMLFGASSIGRDVAPRLASRIKTGLVADCTGLRMAKSEEEIAKEEAMGCEDGTRALLMTRPAFGGNIMATLMCPRTKPQMATVRPGVMKRADKDTSRTGEVVKFAVDFTDADMNVEILEAVKEGKKHADITEAKVLVSGGRGIGGPAGFDILKECAEQLGGEISSSRACVDAGWIENSRQVGQTGKTVRPELYLACGISGAIQHVAGMEGSELVISINKNDTAAIFGVSDLGIVGDVKVIVPKLTEALKKYNAEKNAN
ncbi:MAG: electron transfer flavoprotein subunit alpha/FixB family protein [Lachnospiraceae bacterium]|nr:electron transfer flavoprotein subunit alpha/FixB family protein [Lachnospiraceae bacterium]